MVPFKIEQILSLLEYQLNLTLAVTTPTLPK
jgi:hypothetical protein